MKKRHPSIVNLVRWLTPNPNLPAGQPRYIAREFGEMAAWLIRDLPDSEELTVGLRKLLEAKDCFVRAALAGPDEG